MGLFGKSEDSAQSGSIWTRLTKNRKQHQKSTANTSSANQPAEKSQKQPHDIKSSANRISEDSKKDNFRLSLQSLRLRHHNSSVCHSQNCASCPVTDQQLDSRLRTSKLQCEQLKKKVATISLECSKLESQCRELREVKEQILSFQTDITMLKRKEKLHSEIQQRIAHLEEENFAMVDQVEHLRVKLTELKTEIRPDFIHERLDQLESDSHKLTSITLQNRRDHDRFSLDVGNQLVETFVTQQTIYEEFRRLQHRLVSVERQNQIMSDLIHFHCQNSAMGSNKALMTNSSSSRGAVSLQASTEAAFSSFSPTFSDRDAEKTNTSPSKIDWQFTDQGDSLFLCDTLNKSSEENRELIIGDDKNKDYYKIDFTTKSESLTTLHMTDLSTALSASIISTEDIRNRANALETHYTMTKEDKETNDGSSSSTKCHCRRKEGCPVVMPSRDDGYYSTSHDGTITVDSVVTQGTIMVFQDNKERYLILTRHVQKSRGRSLRYIPLSKSSSTLLVKSSNDLETHIFNRRLRQRQHKQRETQVTDGEEITQVFSDTELYGTRFCIDSDIDDDESPSLFQMNKFTPLKRSFGYAAQKPIKTETKHISNLPPLIEHVSERERRIEIKSSKKSKIVPPKVRAKIPFNNIAQRTELDKSTTKIPQSPLYQSFTDDNNELKQPLSIKPPKYTPMLKPPKVKSPGIPKQSVNLISPKKPLFRKESTKPPPVPPRPKQKMEFFMPEIRNKNVNSFDYVNDPATRMSPEGCQDVPNSRSQMTRNFKDYNPSAVVWSDSFSPTQEDGYNEDDEDVKIVRPDSYDEYYDQEFISELENYQLPKSTVSMLVMQHFK